ncbi:MAG: hypothetical protein R3183_11040, partial [Oleiphilaceae bacterium]|nr:hypothetical protein [Oleiphilaceae bacterium]
YKQYTELCNPGGALFHGFNIDPDFNDCVDGLVVVDIDQLAPYKRKRYGVIQHRASASAQNEADATGNLLLLPERHVKEV